MMRKRSKIIVGLCALLFLVVIAQAAVNLYFGQISSEIDVKQPITIDGLTADNTIEHNFKLWAGDSEYHEHKIGNAGQIDANISQITTGLVTGLDLTITWTNGTLVDFPFLLEGEDKVTLFFTYGSNMNLVEDIYTVKTYFSCEAVE